MYGCKVTISKFNISIPKTRKHVNKCNKHKANPVTAVIPVEDEVSKLEHEADDIDSDHRVVSLQYSITEPKYCTENSWFQQFTSL